MMKSALIAPPKAAYSYSKLTTYDRCSQLFKLIYVDNIPEARQETVATSLGSFCHAGLETFYQDETGTVESPYHALMSEGGIWDQELKRSNLTMLRPDLVKYANHMVHLYGRANPAYKGADAIRKSDGSVSVAPQMTGAWKAYCKKHGLDFMSRKLDNTAAKADKRWAAISLSDVFAQTVGILHAYQNPKDIAAVVAIELPISEQWFLAADKNGKPLLDETNNPVKTSRTRGPHPVFRDENNQPKLIEIENEFRMPELDETTGKLKRDAEGNIIFSEDVLFNGYIDMLARNEAGELIIVDHKTSSGKVPTVEKISRHEQLLVYGFIVYHLSGEMPAAIGINHLRSGRLVLAPFSLERAELAIERLCGNRRGAELSVFVKQDPYGWGSKCIQEKKDNVELCPGLKYCFPDVYELLSSEEIMSF